MGQEGLWLVGQKGRAGSTQPRLQQVEEAGEEKVTMTPKRLTAAHVLPPVATGSCFVAGTSAILAHFPGLETQVLNRLL